MINIKILRKHKSKKIINDMIITFILIFRIKFKLFDEIDEKL